MRPIFNKKIAEKWDLWVSWLKNCWKSYFVCTVHTPKSTITAWKKKKKVENIDMNVGKHKTRFPNAHLGYAMSKKKKKKIKN